MSTPKTMRRLHRWGSVFVVAPALVIFTTGLFLQLKKQWSWVQPPTHRGATTELALSWEAILAAAAAVPEAQVDSWSDIDRLDVRPSLGLIKVRCKNRWEVQLDSTSGALLGSAYRRSDWLESLHDGSWFHPAAKMWIWVPTGVVLMVLWLTGVYLWWLPHGVRRKRRAR